jgi:energy-converting hydrogenase Eha subunit H
MPDRKFLRFKPDENAIALIDLKATTKDFNPTLTALILNESFSGCALVLASNTTLKVHTKIKIKIGNLHVMKGELVWCKTLEENIQKIGVKLLE